MLTWLIPLSVVRLPGVDVRHWTEKPLNEMKGRDWPISREEHIRQVRPCVHLSNYSLITHTGDHIPNPLRSCAENEIPHQLLDIIEKITPSHPGGSPES